MNWLKLSRRPGTHAQAWMSSRHLTVNINIVIDKAYYSRKVAVGFLLKYLNRFDILHTYVL